MKRFNRKKLNGVEDKKQYWAKMSERLADLGNLYDDDMAMP
jgi:hypothetical protein